MELMDHYALGSVAESPELPGEVRYLARQPIMDLRGRVHGYELLYRAGPETCFRGDGNIATRTMLDNTILFGLERLAGGLPAFVNCTQEALVEKMVQVLPARVAVLEILENIEPTPELVAACRQLRAEGYRFALDDFTWKQNFDPLVELADYIKVDFVQCGPEQRQSLLKRLRGAKGSLVAVQFDGYGQHGKVAEGIFADDDESRLDRADLLSHGAERRVDQPQQPVGERGVALEQQGELGNIEFVAAQMLHDLDVGEPVSGDIAVLKQRGTAEIVALKE